MKITANIIPKNIENILNWDIETIGVIIPNNLEKNILDFRKILNWYRFPSKIHTVMKVNTSPAILETGKKMWCSVDISSSHELKKALIMWYDPSSITANGPKNKTFLLNCHEHWVVIAIDSLSEIESLIDVISPHNKQKILIRISGFKWAESTRFWILKEHWEQSVDLLEKYKNYFDVLWYSFHIDKKDIELRKNIFWESITYYKLLKQHWFYPKIINTWGWYGAYYQDDTDIKNGSCNRFHLGSRLYSQDDSPVWANFLKKWLSDKDKFWSSIWAFLEENNIELWIEPGRSLMQNVGYWATRIIAIRKDKIHTSLVLDSNSFWFGMREEELPTDPFLLWESDWWDHEYSLLGNLCLESDIFFCRHIHLHRKAQIWDIIIFPDIAAYHMDFYETESISHPKKTRYCQVHNEFIQDNF